MRHIDHHDVGGRAFRLIVRVNDAVICPMAA